jgi:hypothetical protein
MASFAASRPPVNPVPPFRPVQTCDKVTLHGTAGPLLLEIHTGKRSKQYHVHPVDSDFGRAYTLVNRVTGEAYDVLLDGHASSCTCPGFQFTGGCKHLAALAALQAERRVA